MRAKVFHPVLAALVITFCALTGASAQESNPYFEADTLNIGLGDAPGFVDRSTPQGTMESLFAAAASGRWKDAAHLLDLADIPPDEQPAVGADLARRLETVITRKTVIDWDKLMDRPDALDETASERAATAGQPRKSILLWTLDLKTRPVPIRLNRIGIEGQEPVWVFSRQTVANIDPLFNLYGPSWLEQELPDALRRNTVGGLMVWEIIGLPILLGLAFALGYALWRGLDRLAEAVRFPVTRDILRAIRGPATFGVVTTLLSIATSQVFVFSGRIETVLGPSIALGITISILWLIVNAIDAVLDRLVTFDSKDLTQQQKESQRVMATKIAAGRRALIVVAVMICAGTVLTSTNIFQNLGFSLLGTAGALTLVLGFAARRVLGNIMASLQIALNQSAKIGDRIVYNGELCHVERINFTYVQLRDWDGTRLVVPVEEFASTTFENWTLMDPEMLRIIKVKVAHDADVQRLREEFEELVKELDQDQLGDMDELKVRVADQDVFGKDVWFSLPCADPNTSWDVSCEAREKLLERAARMEKRDGLQIFPEANPAEAA